MSKNLVIVESPAKAKTIEGYLGKDYKVVSSYGHVRDLPKDDLAVDIKNGFKPTYEVSADKKKVITDLKKLAKSAELVYLASDDDREGEAISWHLKEVLDISDKATRRIVFREITKSAIENAIKTPRDIDINLVNAQQARRVLDRLVGFELSPVLWKKIKTGLSAGRVQSVAVRLVVEREREVDHFDTKSSFRVVADFKVGNAILRAELSERFKTYEETLSFLEGIIDSDFKISSLTKKPGKKTPAPPFTTSTLQQEASRKLGFSVSQTMTIAQKLYESGRISYMRTDSLNLSGEAIAAAESAIKGDFGPEYHKTRHYKTKSGSAQEAHEAIRPTDFSIQSVDGDRNIQRLYELIWKRAIASQMSDAVLEKTNVQISISGENRTFQASGEVIKFDGFLKVYLESSDEESDEDQKGMLPPITEGQELEQTSITAREMFSRPPARYTEASLVKKLEEMGIGRPSTYAPTISTIQNRGYVVKETRDGKERIYKSLQIDGNRVVSEEKSEIHGAEKKKLFPTNMAMLVNDFLVEHFPNVTNFSFTADVEKEFDEIAHGEKEWGAMINNFYGKFHEKVEIAEGLNRADIKLTKELGVDPASGKNVIARMGRYGPLVQIGETEGEEKPRFAPLKKEQFIENITLDEALELFKLPRTVGTFEDQDIVAAIGRFGPYLRHDGKFVSLPAEESPYDIKEERSIELIKEKRDADANRIITVFDGTDIQVLNGRYGPYIKAGKKNVRIPKGKDPKELTLEECQELAEKTPEKKKGGKKK